MSKLKISVTERERNFCEDESHAVTDNHTEVVLVNDADDQKPLDKAKLTELIGKVSKDLKVVELGGLKLDNDSVGLIANCGAAVECIRIYDCTGVTDEILKLIGNSIEFLLNFCFLLKLKSNLFLEIRLDFDHRK